MTESAALSGVWLWLAFLVAALATHIPRASFILAGGRVRLPPGLQHALRYAPAAALSALVLPDILLVGGSVQPVNPKLFASVAVFAVALRWRDPWLPFIAGMGVIWLLKPLLA